MDVVLIIGVAFAFFLALLLMVRKEKHLSDKILAAFFILIGTTMLLAWFDFYNRQNNYPIPALLGLSTPLILLHGPCLWFYIKSLTTKNMRFKPLWFLHFLPFVLVSILMTVGYFSLPASEKIALDSQGLISRDAMFYLVVAMIAVSTQGYYIWGLVQIRRYRQKLKTWFSDIQRLNLAWLRSLLIYAIVFYAAISLLYIADALFQFLPYSLLQSLGFAIAAIFNIAIGFRGIRQGNVFADSPVDPAPVSTSKTAPHSKAEDKDAAFVRRLLSHMEDEKPWLDPQLNLAGLSHQLEVTPDYLSAMLNKQLKRRFFDFVNHYRIEAFKGACRNPQNENYSIMGMAYDAGFNSKATFNRVFKNDTGLTPGAYYQNVNSRK